MPNNALGDRFFDEHTILQKQIGKLRSHVNLNFCLDSFEDLSSLHSEIDQLVLDVHKNLVNYLKLAKVPDSSSQATSLSQHQTLANNMEMRVTAENLISTCNKLLLLTTKLKKMLLISDYKTINQEVRDQSTQKLDQIEEEVGQLQAQFSKAEELQEILQMQVSQ